MASKKSFRAIVGSAVIFLALISINTNANVNNNGNSLMVDFEGICRESDGNWISVDCGVPQEFCNGKVIATGCLGIQQLRCICPGGSCIDGNSGKCVPSPVPALGQKECEGSGGEWKLQPNDGNYYCLCPAGMIHLSLSMGGDGSCHDPLSVGKNCMETGGRWTGPSNNIVENPGTLSSLICGMSERAAFMPRRACPEGFICDSPADPFYRCKCPDSFCVNGSGKCVIDSRGSTAPCETVKGEVTTSVSEENGSGITGNICTKYTVKLQKLQNKMSVTQQEGLIEAGRDLRDLTKEEVSPTSSVELQECSARANDLAAGLQAGTFKKETLSSPIRESFSGVSWKYADSIRYYQSKGYLDEKDNELYYWNDQYSYYDYLAGNSFADYKYGRAYSGGLICRIHIDKASKGVIGYEIRTKPTGNAGEFDWQTATQTITRCAEGSARTTCNHRNVYAYNFTYQANRTGEWRSLCQEKPYKCEEIRLAFSPSAEWFASLVRNPAGSTVIPLYDDLISPPTPLTACSDQTGCLSGISETQLAADTWGKGVQKVPSNFVESTQNSLGSASSNVKCQNGVCVAYASGEQLINSTVPESVYYGQCRGYGIRLNPPGAMIPSITNNAKIDVQNRAPAVAVSFSQNPATISQGEEITAYCDAVDPDDCVDKIAKVKWQCFNSQGQTVNCFFGPGGSSSDVFQEGSFIQDISSSDQTNPHRSAIVFKTSHAGGYAVTCETWDNDNDSPLSGYGIAGLSVCEDANNCGGVIPASLKFCSVIMDPEAESSNATKCGTNGTFKFRAYTAGMNPVTYKWKCASSNATTEDSVDPVKECSYGVGSFLPSLTVVDHEGKATECVSQASATVTNTGSCKIEARKSGSGYEYSDKTIKIASGEEIEVRVKRQCLEGGDVEWGIEGGAIISSSGDNARIKATAAGAEGLIKAKAGSVDCGTLDFSVNEDLEDFQIRN